MVKKISHIGIRMNAPKDISRYFRRPRVTFGGFDAPSTTYDEAKVVVAGVPFDGTATYHGGAEHGPRIIRETSAFQIETYSVAGDYDPYRGVGVFDLGDFDFGHVREGDRELIYSPPLRKAGKREIAAAKRRVNNAVKRLNHLTYITKAIRQHGKVPLVLGGEHLVSLYTLRGVANEESVLLWFDAHMDCKKEYLGVKYSHTTPLYYLLHEAPSIRQEDVLLISVREGSPDEFENARSVKLFKAFDDQGFLFNGDRYNRLQGEIRQATTGRKVAITFDIDVFDASLTPRTGTPSYGGMQMRHAADLLGSIAPNAEIIYMDVVEAASDEKDTREGTLAVELLKNFMLAHPSLRR